MSEQEDQLSRIEAAEYLGITSQRLTQLTNAGRLGRRVAGQYWVFTRAELDTFKRERDARPRGRPPKSRSRDADIGHPGETHRDEERSPQA